MGPVADNLDGEQMRAAGEGEIANAQTRKEGFGEQQDLASDLDRKKREQASARETIKAERAQAVDVGGVLGNKVSPATQEGGGTGSRS